MTFQIKADLFYKTPLSDEFERDIELIITSDATISAGQAEKIVQAIYPNRGVEIETCDKISD